MTPQEVLELLVKDRVFYEESGGGVTFTGGEPLAQPDFLLELLILCSRYGLHTAVDTSGYARADVFSTIAEHADLLLFDLKTADNNKHCHYTGKETLTIRKNLFSLQENGPELIIRIPVIPGFNDQLTEMEALCDTLLKINAPVRRVDLLPYHKWGRHKYETLQMRAPEWFSPVDEEISLQEISQLFSLAGFDVKKGG